MTGGRQEETSLEGDRRTLHWRETGGDLTGGRQPLSVAEQTGSKHSSNPLRSSGCGQWSSDQLDWTSVH